jgi:leader peptidase (prepilin peptidase)/N-methyltransferase
MLLHDLPPVFLRAVAACLGLIWGSFLNVVVYRVPREMSVVRPPSHCPACGKPVRPWDNVPVLSYLLLGARARCCNAKLSARYPMVELLGGWVGLGIVNLVLTRLPEDTTVARGAAIFTADFAVSLALIAAAFIDFEHMYLPDTITYGGALLGFGTASLRDLGFLDSGLGAFVGFVSVWVPFILLYGKIAGRPGMGLGDAKLCALAGAWFGWHGALFVLFAGAIQGVLAAGVVYLVRGKIEEPEAVRKDREELERLAAEGDAEAKQILAEDPLLADRGDEGLGKMPFGPFLIMAFLELLLFGREIRAIMGAYFL